MTALSSYLLALAGLSGLALAQSRHYQTVFDTRPDSARLPYIRLAGWAVLALSLTVAVLRWGVSVGMTAWLGLLTVAVLQASLTLTYRPGLYGTVMGIAGGTGLTAFLFVLVQG